MKKQLPAILLALALSVPCVTGCKGQADAPPAQNSASAQPPAQSAEASTDVGTPAPASLYISLGGDDCTIYPYEGEQTPAGLLAGIEELTGWRLSLADEITDGKGGITVMFASDACLFTGPPEEQKDEFHVYDAAQFTLAVLRSVQKTLQNWASPTNPDSVDVYFGMEGDLALTLENLGVIWPLESPYSHDGMAALLKKQESNERKGEQT